MLDCFLVLVVLQIARIIIKNILLSVLNFTDINLNIANIISIMIVGISVFMFLRGSSLFNPAGNRLTEMANKYDNKKIRIILFIITLISLILTVVFKTEYIFYELIVMCLATIVVPLYEELLFRKYLWNYVNSFVENQKTTWVVITIMSVLFILGYFLYKIIKNRDHKYKILYKKGIGWIEFAGKNSLRIYLLHQPVIYLGLLAYSYF